MARLIEIYYSHGQQEEDFNGDGPPTEKILINLNISENQYEVKVSYAYILFLSRRMESIKI